MKRITSYTSHLTAEGQRLNYTYSVIDDNGNILESNTRATCIVTDQNVLDANAVIERYLNSRLS